MRAKASEIEQILEGLSITFPIVTLISSYACSWRFEDSKISMSVLENGKKIMPVYERCYHGIIPILGCEHLHSWHLSLNVSRATVGLMNVKGLEELHGSVDSNVYINELSHGIIDFCTGNQYIEVNTTRFEAKRDCFEDFECAKTRDSFVVKTGVIHSKVCIIREGNDIIVTSTNGSSLTKIELIGILYVNETVIPIVIPNIFEQYSSALIVDHIA